MAVKHSVVLLRDGKRMVKWEFDGRRKLQCLSPGFLEGQCLTVIYDRHLLPFNASVALLLYWDSAKECKSLTRLCPELELDLTRPTRRKREDLKLGVITEQLGRGNGAEMSKRRPSLAISPWIACQGVMRLRSSKANGGRPLSLLYRRQFFIIVTPSSPATAELDDRFRGHMFCCFALDSGSQFYLRCPECILRLKSTMNVYTGLQYKG
jgi:hypothetical protein